MRVNIIERNITYGMKRGVFVLLTVLFLTSYATAISLGAGPGDITFKNMPKGGYAKKMMMVNNLEGYDLSITITPDKKFSDWISFEPSESFVLPSRSRRDLWAVLNLPEDVANGNYTGEIIVNAAPKIKAGGSGGTGLVVGASVSLATRIEVTGVEVLGYNIKRVLAESNELGYPIPIHVMVLNTGNVRITPSIRVDVFDLTKTRILKSYDFADAETFPGLQEDIPFNLSSMDLGVGDYWANVTGYLNGESVGSGFAEFSVLEEGTLSIEGELVSIMVDKNVEIGEIVKVIAEFKNVGQLPVSAKFKGEVKLDGKLVETLDTENIRIEPGKSVNFTAYFTPTKQGTYSIEGHALFSEKTTDTKTAVLKIETKQERGGYTTYIIIALVVIVLLVVILKFIKK